MGTVSKPVGPVQSAVFGFPGSNFSGEIAPALADLVDKGIIRVLDLVFAIKDADGNDGGRRARRPRSRQPGPVGGSRLRRDRPFQR